MLRRHSFTVLSSLAEAAINPLALRATSRIAPRCSFNVRKKVPSDFHSRTTLSFPLAAIYAPLSLQSTPSMGAGVSKVAIGVPSACHKLTVRSELTETSRGASETASDEGGQKATSQTAASRSLRVRRKRPSRLHNLIVKLVPAVAKVLPSGLNATLQGTVCRVCRVCSSWGLLLETSHSFAVSSPLEEATIFPSG